MFGIAIRDVLWLMVVVALSCAWWAEHSRASNLARGQQAFELLSRQISLDGYKASIVGNSLMVSFPDGIILSRKGHLAAHAPLLTPHAADPVGDWAAADGGRVVGQPE